ncbi:hypothetical protein [Mangrovibacterium sp.]|uniref:hypothetical protein n=1 Tax=Mangrovibacterium sp. TaxID=1961364 RepID=UPI003564D929
MTEADIQLIKKSYPQIKGNLPRLAKYFYNRIADLDSELDQLFADDKANHGIEFSRIVEVASNSIEDTKTALPEIKQLEAKLNYYNIQPDALDTIGAVFIDTLAFGFGNNFTPQVMKPWVTAYKEYAALFYNE